MKLLQSKLTDDELLDAFYDKVIENYRYPGKLFYYFWFMTLMIFRKSQQTALKILMHRNMCMTTFFAASVRLS